MNLSHLTDEELKDIVGNYSSSKESTPIPSNESENNGISEALSALGHGYTNYAKGALRGTGQALGDIGASIGNLGISGAEKLFGKKIPHIPHPDLINKSPGSSAESFGQELSQLVAPFTVPGVAGYKAANLGKNLLQKLLISGGTGAGIGYAENEDNRGLGALTGLAGGLIGGGAPALSKLRSKNIAQELSGEKASVVSKYKDLYKNLFGENKNDLIKKPNINAEKIIQHSSKDYNSGLKNFLSNPTLENAQNAQSDMGKFVSYLNKSSMSKPLTSQKLKALEAAKDAQKRLRGSIMTELEKISPGKAEEYGKITKGYGEEVVPFTRSKYLTEFEKGDLGSKDLIKKLLNDPKFMAQVSKKIPTLNQRKNLEALKNNKLATGAAIGVGAAYLPYEIRKLLNAH